MTLDRTPAPREEPADIPGFPGVKPVAGLPPDLASNVDGYLYGASAPPVTPDLGELERLAREATPGPWHFTRLGRVCVTPGPHAYSHVVCDADEDAAYIAAASPDVVLALLRELGEARRERDGLREAVLSALRDRWSAERAALDSERLITRPEDVTDFDRGMAHAERILDALIRTALAATPRESRPALDVDE